MSTPDELKAKSLELAQKIDYLRRYLVRPTTVEFFRVNPSKGGEILTNTGGLKTRVAVLWGLKEFIEKDTDFLPSKEDLLNGKINTWLQTGDIIVGVIGYLADYPRVIDSVELTGYRWHFLNDADNIKGPGLGPMKTDKWFQSYGWIKASSTDLAEIKTELDNEISELSALIHYFASKAFLQLS